MGVGSHEWTNAIKISLAMYAGEIRLKRGIVVVRGKIIQRATVNTGKSDTNGTKEKELKP